ncbi:MAG TPA: hypothetical protein VM925_38220, partial [Labilithrix sp.]|nr:hypothetical protein [Labilithrix sp.]
YLPGGVRLTSASIPEYCAGGARAFHRSLEVGGSKARTPAKLAYAVLPRCSDETELTATASHELLEATTNPDPVERGFAFARDSSNLAFTASGLEPVDPCGLITMDGHWTLDSGFAVQRAWSNRAAALGHDPCVPARRNRPYVALVPRTPTVRLVGEGERVTITLDAKADRPVPKWATSVLDVTGFHEHAQYVDVSLDRSVVQDGDSVNLTIVVRKRNENGLVVVGAVSTLGVSSHMWPVAIVTR